jgi:hypothetical protein
MRTHSGMLLLKVHHNSYKVLGLDLNSLEHPVMLLPDSLSQSYLTYFSPSFNIILTNL